MTADLTPGMKVRVSYPESPRAYRRGQVGVVRDLSERPSRIERDGTLSPSRWLVWVVFRDDVLGNPTRMMSPFWDSELEVLS